MSTVYSSNPPASVQPDSVIFPHPWSPLPTRLDDLPDNVALTLADMGKLWNISYPTLYKWAESGTYDATGRHICLQVVNQTHGRRTTRHTTKKWVAEYIALTKYQHRQSEVMSSKGVFTFPARPKKISDDNALAGRSAIYPQEISSALKVELITVLKWLSEGKGKFKKTVLKSVAVDGKKVTCQDWIDDFFIAVTGRTLPPIRGSRSPLPRKVDETA